MPKSINTTPSDDDNQYSEHTERPFCYDSRCPCKESHSRRDELAEAVKEGLASVNDAIRIYQGRTV